MSTPSPVTTPCVTPSATSPATKVFFCGMSAIYAGLAQVINEVYGKKLLPL